MTTSTDTITCQTTVEAAPEDAYAFFTGRMGSWWNPGHHIGEQPFADVVVEPHAGGRWFEVDADGVQCQWGRVLAWEPPDRVLLAWQLDASWRFDPDLLTELEIRFVAEGPTRTRVELEHRGLEAYGDAAPAMRAQMESAGGWEDLLDRLRRAASGDA